MFIFIGIGLFVIAILFVIAEKVTPNSVMMVSFQGNKKKKLIALLIISVLLFSYGMYQRMTYKLPYIDIEIGNQEQTIFGNINELGYFSDSLLKKEQKNKLSIVLWENINVTNIEVSLLYPSGKKEIWKPDIAKLDKTTFQKATKQFGIKEIYELSPYIFKESGTVQFTLKNEGEKIRNMSIKIK